MVSRLRSPADVLAARLNHLHRRLRDELLHVGTLREPARHGVERAGERAELVLRFHVDGIVEVARRDLLGAFDQTRDRRRDGARQQRAGGDAGQDGQRRRARAGQSECCGTAPARDRVIAARRR